MTRRQLITIVAINTALALLISVGVVWAGLRLGVLSGRGQPTPYVIVPPTATWTPVVTPTATRPLTPTPTIVTQEYEVQPGDTLLAIALRAGLSLEELMALNEISNADRLLVGQRLRVPLGSLPTATPTLTATLEIPPSLTATLTTTQVVATPAVTAPQAPLTGTIPATTTVTPAPARPVILEVIAPGDPATEAVVLANQGDQPLLLRNWSLLAEDGRRYVFPDFTLSPGAVVRIHTGSGVDTLEDLHWAQAQAAWVAGAAVSLHNQAGQQILVYRVTSLNP